MANKAKEPRTDLQVVMDCNELAREFYQLHGYVVPEGYRFDQASHPQEQLMWRLASLATVALTDTDPEDALTVPR